MSEHEWFDYFSDRILFLRRAELRSPRRWWHLFWIVFDDPDWTPVDFYEHEGLPLGPQRATDLIGRLYTAQQLRRFWWELLGPTATTAQIEQQQALDRDAELLEHAELLAEVSAVCWIFTAGTPAAPVCPAVETALRVAGSFLRLHGWTVLDGHFEEWRSEVHAVPVTAGWNERIRAYYELAQLHFRPGEDAMLI